MTNCYLLSVGFVTVKLVIITNFVVVSSVGIKRVVCIIIIIIIIILEMLVINANSIDFDLTPRSPFMGH